MPAEDNAIRPFQVSFPQTELTDLRQPRACRSLRYRVHRSVTSQEGTGKAAIPVGQGRTPGEVTGAREDARA
jgi:hypothetical protein